MMQEPLLVLGYYKQKVSWTKFTSEPSLCWHSIIDYTLQWNKKESLKRVEKILAIKLTSKRTGHV